MEIIGLSGYARSGKDEAAKVLVEEFGFTRVAFADKLREVLLALDPLVSSQRFTDYRHRRLSSVIREFGWDGYKESDYSDEIRRLLQRLGTEAGRQTLWDSIWVDAALTGHDESARLVVTDCRFPNEAQAILDSGGTLWRIKRKGNAPANLHPSETSLDDWEPFHVRISNNGTLEQFQSAVRSVYSHYDNEYFAKGHQVMKFSNPIVNDTDEWDNEGGK